MDAFWDELENLGGADFALQFKVASAFFPEVMREAVKDEMAEHGITLVDLREVLKKRH